MALDARGLHPGPGEIVGANGAAMATLANVLGFDLASWQPVSRASGITRSLSSTTAPKEADMEPILYDRLFQFAE